MLRSIVSFCIFLGLSLLVGFSLFMVMDNYFPKPDPLQLKKFSQLVVDKHGRPLRAFADDFGVWRYPTSVDKVSKEYLDALINYEDRLFLQHRGINPLSMLRAVKQMIFNARAISGGSTLTMQVARILEPHQKSFSGKLWQMFRAFQLEYYLDKNQILNLYLNYAPFGGPIEGVEAASFTYLAKSADQLTTAEAAMLAVLPQSPSRLRPDRHPLRAQAARDKVLRRILSFGVWSNQKVKEALAEPVVAEFNSRPMIAPLLARYLVSQNPNKAIIHTNIEFDLQLSVADMLKDYLHQFSSNTSAAAMIMENQSMNVVAYVGAADFGNLQRFGHIDMVRAIRSPGSTLKPFIYAQALDEKLIHAESLLQDVPLDFAGYNPENFSKNFAGPVSASQALQRSLNIPAVQVLNHIGSVNFATRLQNAGMQLYFPGNAKPSLSLALGGVGVKMADLVAVYSALANDGQAGEPRYLQDEKVERRFLMSPQAAWIIGEILAGVPLDNRRQNHFLKKQKRWLAHKTGTSYGFRDAWMVAVSQQHTIAVWVGKPDGTPSPGEFGRRTAAPLMRRIVNLLPVELTNRKQPEQISLQSICWPLGKLRELTETTHCRKARAAYLINDIAPATLKEGNDSTVNPMQLNVSEQLLERVFPSCYQGRIDKLSIALWPIRLEPWLPKSETRANLIPPVSSRCEQLVETQQQLTITGVERDSLIKLTKFNGQSLSLNLSVVGSQSDLVWLLNGKHIGRSSIAEGMVVGGLTKGKYSVFVFNSQGQTGAISFQVF